MGQVGKEDNVIKVDFKEIRINVVEWIRVAGGRVAGSREYGNKNLVSIKGHEIIEELSDYHRLKQHSTLSIC